MSENKALLDRALAVVPSERQILWQKTEYYNFIHFGLNTFYGKEWGDGNYNMKKFNPKKLDTDQWVRAFKASGSRGVILTVKHHDGFCLYPSKYTDYCIKNTPYKNGKGDIVRELADSCRKYGLKLGIYLSPWDRHEKTYSTPAYNDFFANQLTELMTSYGEIFSVWFDGACGEQDPEKRQIYDFPRFYEIIRKYQPNAVISVCGPDVRWIGNEGGQPRECEWSVVSRKLCDYDVISKNSQQSDDIRFMNKPMLGVNEDLGSLKALENEDELCWYPAETDVSITKKCWFWQKGVEIFYTRSAEELMKLYYTSVGHNSTLLLNVPVNRKGLVPQKFINRLEKFGKLKEKAFSKKAAEAEYEPGKYEITLNFAKTKITKAVIGENLQFSQRVESYTLTSVINGCKTELSKGTTVGYKEIKLFDTETDNITLTVTKCRREPHIRLFEIYE